VTLLVNPFFQKKRLFLEFGLQIILAEEFSRMFFAFVAILVGFGVDVRMIERLFDSKIVHKHTAQVLKHSFFCIYFVLAVFFVKKPTLIWSIIIILKFVLLIFEKFLKKYRENKFNINILLFLDRVILFVQAGKSFRVALERSHEAGDVFTQQRTLKILESVCFAQQTTSTGTLGDFIVSELRQIDLNAHKTLPRLEQLRRQIKIESDFRQKSEQISLRFRIQSYVMSALYLAILAVVTRVCEISRIWPLILASNVFFTAGFVWVYMTGKRIKWKV
jgi:hypothetical protein